MEVVKEDVKLLEEANNILKDKAIRDYLVTKELLEGNTNTVLYSQNAHEKLPMASTTKIITAILAIENTEDLVAEMNNYIR